MVCLFGIGIVSLIFTITFNSNFINISGQSMNLKAHWETDLVKGVEGCAENGIEGKERIWEGKFGGTKDGCDCINSSPRREDGVSRRMYTGTCGYNQTQAGCTGVPAIAAKNLTYWSDRSMFCITRINGSSLKLIIENQKSDTECKEGYKACNTGSPQLVCLKDSNECPISDVAISDTANSTYTETASSQLTKITATRSEKLSAIVDLPLDEGDMCQSKYLHGLTEGRAEYILLNDARTRCEPDNHYSKLSNISEAVLFAVNGLDIRRLTHYPNGGVYSKFKRHLIPMKIKFKKDFMDFFNVGDQLKRLEQYSSLYFWAIAVFYGLMFIYFLITWIYEFSGKPFHLGWFVFLPIVVIFFGISIFCVIQFSGFDGYFTRMGEGACSDMITNKYFSDTATTLNTQVLRSLYYSIACTVALLILMVIKLFMNIWYMKVVYKERDPSDFDNEQFIDNGFEQQTYYTKTPRLQFQSTQYNPQQQGYFPSPSANY